MRYAIDQLTLATGLASGLVLLQGCKQSEPQQSEPRQSTGGSGGASGEVGGELPEADSASGEGSLDEHDPDAGQPSELVARVAGLTVPLGLRVELYTDEVPEARSLAVGRDGVVFVGTKSDRVYAIVDSNQDGRVDAVLTLATELDVPNGVAYRDGDLYVAEIGQISRYRGIDGTVREQLEQPRAPTPEPERVIDSLPHYLRHGRRYIRFGPDGWLYVGIGVPCDVCEPESPTGTIARLQPEADAPSLEIYATGVRNSVGFDWHPEDGALWFTDNGRDGLGDNLPPDELDRAPTAGLDFGFPGCHGGFVVDPEFGEPLDCVNSVAPIAQLGPHVAALGMRFYTGEQFPAPYQGNPIIAQHGSWDRSEKIGYRVVVALVAEGVGGWHSVSVEPMVQGFLDRSTGEAWGRPVDVAVLDDGSLLISDDLAGAVYRVSRDG
jgi:glucose/arabinose dehydrogenase